MINSCYERYGSGAGWFAARSVSAESPKERSFWIQCYFEAEKRHAELELKRWFLSAKARASLRERIKTAEDFLRITAQMETLLHGLGV